MIFFHIIELNFFACAFFIGRYPVYLFFLRFFLVCFTVPGRFLYLYSGLVSPCRRYKPLGCWLVYARCSSGDMAKKWQSLTSAGGSVFCTQQPPAWALANIPGNIPLTSRAGNNLSPLKRPWLKFSAPACLRPVLSSPADLPTCRPADRRAPLLAGHRQPPGHC